ncbi:helix-turn-helix transcriptional regulator [Microlunatus speluncae]|uniref:helix-turn-helix transcriptional regulator n=1 Tax=Microlunatus speluncae TaxID=2594267 RepID=UPI00126633C2|nr:AAA family ATPase [Microlunatus speluncae]
MGRRGLAATPVVGRERELAAAAAAVSAIPDGPIACVIHGSAGIGKTTVWSEAVAAAEASGYRLLICRPTQSEAMFSFMGLGDLLDRLPDQALAALPAAQRSALEVALLRADGDELVPDHRAVRVGVLELIRAIARETPIMIAIDDAQWLDQPTAAVVEHVVRRLSDEPVGVLAALRDDHGVVVPWGLNRALPPDRFVRIGLGGLSLGALHNLVRVRTGLALTRPTLHDIERACEGNPFYALEIAGALARSGRPLLPGDQLPIPENLSELVVHRIEALPPPARSALATVATMVQPTIEVIRAVLITPEELEGFALAEEAGIVEVTEGRVRFTHPLLASAIRTGLSSSHRRRLHQRLATVIDDVEQRAWHLAWATLGRETDVAAALEAAATSAHGRGAPGSAAQFWELAALRTPDEQPAIRFRRLAAAGSCLFHAGDATRARTLLEAGSRGLPPGPDRARVLVELAEVIFYQGNPREAVDLCTEASADAGEDRTMRIIAGLCTAWYATHDVRAQLRTIEATRALLREADATDDPELYACVNLMAEYYRFYNGLGIDRARVDSLHDLIPPNGRSWTAAWAGMAWRGIVKLIDPPVALAAYAASDELFRSVGDEAAVATTLMHSAELDCRLGHWTRAEEQALQSIEILDQAGQWRWRGFALYARGLVEAHLGELESAQQAATEALELASTMADPWVSAMQLGLLGFIEFSRDDLEHADDYYSSADALIEQMGVAEPARHAFHGDHCEVVIARGDLARAGRLLARLEQRAEIAPYPWLVAITARCRGLLRLATGDLDGAAEALAAALLAHEDVPLPFDRARTLLINGRLLRRRKEKLAARQALLAALKIFAELGAPLWIAKASDELGRLGLRRGSVGELTPTEERIAKLVAAGLSNREVAASIFISPKTVEATLSRVYRKLGIQSRHGLATFRFPDQRHHAATRNGTPARSGVVQDHE